jgi:methylmalonyl-CoA mutase N-terminal domain/subunit
VARAQTAKLVALRKRRSNEEVKRCLDALKRAAEKEPGAGAASSGHSSATAASSSSSWTGGISTANTMPYIIDAVRAYATVGEICEALREVYGIYTEVSVT